MGEDPELRAVPGSLGCVVVLVRGPMEATPTLSQSPPSPAPFPSLLPISSSFFSTCTGMRSKFSPLIFFLPRKNMLLSTTHSLLRPISEGKASIPLSSVELLTWVPDSLPPGPRGSSALTSSPFPFGPSASPLLLTVLILVSSGSYNKTSQTGWQKPRTFVSRGSESWEVQDQGAGTFSVC